MASSNFEVFHTVCYEMFVICYPLALLKGCFHFFLGKFDRRQVYIGKHG